MDISDNRYCKLKTDEILRLRQARGWSVEDLAEATGLGVKTFTRINDGERVFFRTARLIASALSVSCESLLLAPLNEPIVRQNGEYRFSITTIGMVHSPEQLAVLGDIAKEIVQRLSAAGMEVDAHEHNLQLMQRGTNAPFAVVRITAPLQDRKHCVYPPEMFRGFAYLLLPLDEYDLLINSQAWTDRCTYYFINHSYMYEFEILSGRIYREKTQREAIEDVLKNWCLPRS